MGAGLTCGGRMRRILLVVALVAGVANAAVAETKKENPDGPNGTAWVLVDGWGDVSAKGKLAGVYQDIKVSAMKYNGQGLTLGVVMSPMFTLNGWIDRLAGSDPQLIQVDGSGYYTQHFTGVRVGASLKFYFNPPPAPVRRAE